MKNNPDYKNYEVSFKYISNNTPSLNVNLEWVVKKAFELSQLIATKAYVYRITKDFLYIALDVCKNDKVLFSISRNGNNTLRKVDNWKWASEIEVEFDDGRLYREDESSDYIICNRDESEYVKMQENMLSKYIFELTSDLFYSKIYLERPLD